MMTVTNDCELFALRLSHIENVVGLYLAFLEAQRTAVVDAVAHLDRANAITRTAHDQVDRNRQTDDGLADDFVIDRYRCRGFARRP